MAGKSTAQRRTVRVTRTQVEVARAKVDADRVAGRPVDPLVRMIADAGRGPRAAEAR